MSKCPTHLVVHEYLDLVNLERVMHENRQTGTLMQLSVLVVDVCTTMADADQCDQDHKPKTASCMCLDVSHPAECTALV